MNFDKEINQIKTYEMFVPYGSKDIKADRIRIGEDGSLQFFVAEDLVEARAAGQWNLVREKNRL